MSAGVIRRPHPVQLDWQWCDKAHRTAAYRARLVGVDEADGVRCVDRAGTSGLELFTWSTPVWACSHGWSVDRDWVCWVEVVGPGRCLLTTQGWHPSGRRHRAFYSSVSTSAAVQAAFEHAERWARRRFRNEWRQGWGLGVAETTVECWQCGAEDDGAGTVGGDGHWLCDECDS